MSVLDIANTLSDEIKKSKEYVDFKEIREKINSDPELKSKIDQFEKMRYNEQILAIQQNNQNEDGIRKLQEIYQILMQDEIIKDYFDKQVKFNVLIADVNKIIGNAIKDVL